MTHDRIDSTCRRDRRRSGGGSEGGGDGGPGHEGPGLCLEEYLEAMGESED